MFAIERSSLANHFHWNPNSLSQINPESTW